MRRLAAHLHGAWEGLRVLAFSADGRLLASGGGPFDARVVVHDLQERRCVAELDLLEGALRPKHAEITALAFGRDTLTAVGDPADFPGVSLRVWRTGDWRLIEQRDHEGAGQPDWLQLLWEQLLGAEAEGMLLRSEIYVLSDPRRLEPHALDRRGNLAFIDEEGVALLDRRADRVLRLPTLDNETCIAISEHAELISLGGDNRAVDFLPGGALLPGGARLFVRNGDELIETQCVLPDRDATAVALSADGSSLAVASERTEVDGRQVTLTVWRVSRHAVGLALEQTGEQVVVEPVGALAFSPDGTRLAVGHPSGCELFEPHAAPDESPPAIVPPLRFADEALRQFAEPRAAAGRLDEAFTAAAAASGAEGARALVAVANAQQEAGFDPAETLTLALQAAASMQPTDRREQTVLNRLLTDIAKAAAQVAPKTALEAAHAITSAYGRTLTLAAVAVHQQGAARAEIFAEALEMADLIGGELDRASALKAIALAQAAVGLAGEARTTTGRIESLFLQAQTFSELAELAAGDERRELAAEAVAAARAIEDRETRERLIATLGESTDATHIDA